MILVSDTGPLIGLGKISQLSLLKALAQDVWIPPMVRRELLSKVGSEAEEIDQA